MPCQKQTGRVTPAPQHIQKFTPENWETLKICSKIDTGAKANNAGNVLAKLTELYYLPLWPPSIFQVTSWAWPWCRLHDHTPCPCCRFRHILWHRLLPSFVCWYLLTHIQISLKVAPADDYLSGVHSYHCSGNKPGGTYCGVQGLGMLLTLSGDANRKCSTFTSIWMDCAEEGTRALHGPETEAYVQAEALAVRCGLHTSPRHSTTKTKYKVHKYWNTGSCDTMTYNGPELVPIWTKRPITPFLHDQAHSWTWGLLFGYETVFICTKTIGKSKRHKFLITFVIPSYYSQEKCSNLSDPWKMNESWGEGLGYAPW